MTPRALYRIAAGAEAITWTLLLLGIVVRATTGWALGVTIGGGIHGFVFLAYAATALVVGIDRRWPVGTVVLAVAAAVVPYATLLAEHLLDRRGLLGGAWNLEPDPSRADRTPLDALVRWFVRRPALLVAVAVVVLVAIFVTLLLVGPPGGRD